MTKKPVKKTVNLKKPKMKVRVPLPVEEKSGLVVDPKYGVPILNQHASNKSKTRQKGRSIQNRSETNSRIEEVRALLTMSVSSKDIVRTLMTKWNIKRAMVYRYIEVAKRRQLAILDRTGAEAKADSLSYWSQRLIEATQRKQKALKDLEDSRAVISQVRDTLTRLNDNFPDQKNVKAVNQHIERIDECRRALNLANELRDGARRAIHSANQEAFSIQDRIDKLVGNYSPEKINLVDNNGASVSFTEPITHEQAKLQLVVLLQQAITVLPEEDRSKLTFLPGTEGLQSGESIVEQLVEQIPIEVVQEGKK